MITIGKVTTRARRAAKHARQQMLRMERAPSPLLHVIGCQRSGTTMLTELLDRDRRVRVFGELGVLFDDEPRHHRLRDLDEVRRRLARSGAALNVVKPLVESHRCDELLGLQSGARAIWMFRHHRDVAASNLRRFGIRNGIDNLRPIVRDDPSDWRNAGLTDPTRRLVRHHFDEHMAPHDAAALFWYCRNTLCFEQLLGSDDRVRTCRYEQLVEDPATMLDGLYRWIGLPPAADAAADLVHRDSVGKGQDEVGAPIRGLCDDMWNDLCELDERRSLAVRS